MKTQFRFLTVIIMFFLIIGSVSSQVLETKSLTPERGYEAIEIKFDATNLDSLSVSGIPTSQLFLYAYHSGQGWQAIPFQIDENDPFVASNDTIETTDVLIFLANDLGDKVTRGNWIANPESQSNNRYEIEVVDPLDRSKKGWCYLFVSATLSEQDKSPIKYVSYDTTSDQFMGKYYQIDYDKKWYPENIRITSEGSGNNQDFYDRTKIRLNIQLGPFTVYTVIEDSLLFRTDQPTVFSSNSVVRLKRKLNLMLLPFKSPMSFRITYYPYSTVFSGDIGFDQYVGLVTVKMVRMSYDLNSSAAGMQFFSGDEIGFKNQNISIDGNGELENVDTSLVKKTKNWTMTAGVPGTLLTINDVRYESNPPAVKPEPYDQYLYYWDDQSGKTLPSRNLDPKYDWDTGDSSSFGDHGMAFESYALTDSLHYLSTTYYIGANQSGTVAQNMFKNFNTPILSLVYVTEQKYSTSVDFIDDNRVPIEYRLRPNFPNPFNPSTTITFDLPKDDLVTLQIYDVQGKEIITLVNQQLNAGVHRYLWNGRDKNNNLVSSGIYICTIKTMLFSASQKIAFVK